MKLENIVWITLILGVVILIYLGYKLTYIMQIIIYSVSFIYYKLGTESNKDLRKTICVFILVCFLIGNIIYYIDLVLSSVEINKNLFIRD